MSCAKVLRWLSAPVKCNREVNVKSPCILLLLLLVVFPFVLAQGQERHTEKSFKGVELYSWKNSNGEWMFSLVPGTNRNKTEAEVKKSQISGPEELAKRFSQLAEGEQIFWFHYGLKGFAYPDEKMIAEVESSAKKAKVDLRIPPKDARNG